MDFNYDTLAERIDEIIFEFALASREIRDLNKRIVDLKDEISSLNSIIE